LVKRTAPWKPLPQEFIITCWQVTPPEEPPEELELLELEELELLEEELELLLEELELLDELELELLEEELEPPPQFTGPPLPLWLLHVLKPIQLC